MTQPDNPTHPPAVSPEGPPAPPGLELDGRRYWRYILDRRPQVDLSVLEQACRTLDDIRTQAPLAQHELEVAGTMNRFYLLQVRLGVSRPT